MNGPVSATPALVFVNTSAARPLLEAGTNPLIQCVIHRWAAELRRRATHQFKCCYLGQVTAGIPCALLGGSVVRLSLAAPRHPPLQLGERALLRSAENQDLIRRASAAQHIRSPQPSKGQESDLIPNEWIFSCHHLYVSDLSQYTASIEETPVQTLGGATALPMPLAVARAPSMTWPVASLA